MNTIRIPKLSEGEIVPVNVIKSESNDKQLTLAKQTIAGVVIPNGTTVLIRSNSWHWIDRNYSKTVYYIPAHVINPTLRFLYLETIRNKK